MQFLWGPRPNKSGICSAVWTGPVQAKFDAHFRSRLQGRFRGQKNSTSECGAGIRILGLKNKSLDFPNPPHPTPSPVHPPLSLYKAPEIQSASMAQVPGVPTDCFLPALWSPLILCTIGLWSLRRITWYHSVHFITHQSFAFY